MDFFYYIIIGLIIYGVVAGLMDKGIFYNDQKDVLISLVPLAVIVITFILSGLLGDWFNYIGGTVFIASIIYIIYNSFEYNKIFLLAISIGIAKILLSTVTVFAAILAITDKTSDGRYSTGYRDTDSSWLTTILAIAATSLAYKLINGDRINQTIETPQN